MKWKRSPPGSYWVNLATILITLSFCGWQQCFSKELLEYFCILLPIWLLFVCSRNCSHLSCIHLPLYHPVSSWASLPILLACWNCWALTLMCVWGSIFYDIIRLHDLFLLWLALESIYMKSPLCIYHGIHLLRLHVHFTQQRVCRIYLIFFPLYCALDIQINLRNWATAQNKSINCLLSRTQTWIAGLQSRCSPNSASRSA